MLLNYSHWAPANTYPFLSTKGVFFIVSAYRLQVSGDRKRIFSKRIFSKRSPAWRSLGNVSFSFTRGQKKTQVFDLSDVRSRSIGSWMMSYIIYYACSVRNAIEIPPFNCFPVYGRKRSTCFLWTRVFFFLQNWRNIWIRLDGTWKSFQAHVAL